MKKISLPEFYKQYHNSYKEIIFSSENQQDEVGSTICADFAFTKMTISYNPNVVFLADGDNSLKFKKVKYVLVREEPCILGSVLTLVCGDSESQLNDIGYTIVVR